MKNRIAKRMSTIAPSLTLAISAKAKAMKEAWEDVVSFGVGEPDFNTPARVIDAATSVSFFQPFGSIIRCFPL